MKRWLRVVIAAAVVTALVIALVLVRRAPDDAGSDQTTPVAGAGGSSERVAVLELARDSIRTIEVDREGDTLLLRSSGDTTFKPEYPYEVKWAASRVDRIVGSVASLQSSRVIDETPSNPGDYGLQQPQAAVHVTLSDGTTIRLDIGNRLPGGGGYYVSRGDEAVVYSVSSAWISPFFYTLGDLRDKTLPQVNPAQLEEIAIATVDGRAIRVESVTERDPEMTLSTMAVTAPFKRRYSASSTWLDELAQSIPEVEISRFVEDRPSDLGPYGLDPPQAQLRLNDGESVLQLDIGLPTDEGRFARLPDGNSVFVVQGVEDVIRTTPYETISAFAYIISIDLVDRIVVEAETERYEARIQREPAPNPDDPEAEPEVTYYWNGEEMEEDLFKDLYQWMIGLLMDAEADRPRDGEAELSITYFLNNGQPDVTVRFVPLDSNYDAVFRNGVAEFKISRNKIGRLKAALADPPSIQD